MFSVQVRLRNWQNKFLPKEKQGEEVVCDAIVDSGAMELALPGEIVERLKLELLQNTSISTHNDARQQRRMVGIVELDVQGRKCCTTAAELPEGATPILGWGPLAEMDWHIDPLEEKLVGRPESPDKPLLPMVKQQLAVGSYDQTGGTMKITRFEEMKSWQEARKLTKLVCELTMKGPFARDFGLRDQIRRACVSIMANIAEGFNRRTTREFANFLSIALASASETKSHLYVALDLGYIDQSTFDELYEETSSISKLITGFMQYLAGHGNE